MSVGVLIWTGRKVNEKKGNRGTEVRGEGKKGLCSRAGTVELPLVTFASKQLDNQHAETRISRFLALNVL